MKKPELLTTVSSLDELHRLIQAGADAIVIGERRFGLRLAGDFPLPAFEAAAAIAKEAGVKVYASVNRLMDNELAAALPDYLHALGQINPDAIIFGDPAVVMACRQAGLQIPLHWDGEMTTTNHASAGFWGRQGAVRAVLARELNLDQIEAFKQNTALEVQVQVHGATVIYHSRRHLVNSYLTHHGKTGGDTGMDRGFYAVEPERPDLFHPVFEDADGTHIISPEDICLLELLPDLMEAGVDSFYVEGLLKSPEYNETVVRAYRAAIDRYVASPGDYGADPAWLASIQQLQDPNRELTYGFLFKEQIY